MAADDLQIPVHRTHDVNAPTSLREIAAAQPDVIVTAAFGQKLKREILALPHHGCLNVHASLLPSYRGASPIAAAIRDGAPEIGVTIFRMTKGWDTGPVLSRRGVALGADTTLDEATAQLAEIGADLLVESLDRGSQASSKPFRRTRPRRPTWVVSRRKMASSTGRCRRNACTIMCAV